MAMSGARITPGTSHHGWPRAPKAISAPARRTRPSRPSHRRGAPVTTPSAAETVPCPGGGVAIRPAPRSIACLLRQSDWWMLSDSRPRRRHRAGNNESHEVFGGGFEVAEPVGQRLVQGFLHPGGVGFDGLAAEGLLRGHVDACGCLGEDPL